jgi:hypothetical protein
MQLMFKQGDFIRQFFLNFFGKIDHFSGRLEGSA